MTGNADPRTRSLALEAGVDGFIANRSGSNPFEDSFSRQHDVISRLLTVEFLAAR